VALIASSIFALSLATAAEGQQAAQHQQLTISNEWRVPGVDLNTYTLITSNPDADRPEAEAILEAKVSWPRAMQTKDAFLFDRILARGFTFREADGRLLERDAYIRDRVRRAETRRLSQVRERCVAAVRATRRVELSQRRLGNGCARQA